VAGEVAVGRRSRAVGSSGPLAHAASVPPSSAPTVRRVAAARTRPGYAPDHRAPLALAEAEC
jgi:hypothetical protein